MLQVNVLYVSTDTWTQYGLRCPSYCEKSLQKSSAPKGAGANLKVQEFYWHNKKLVNTRDEDEDKNQDKQRPQCERHTTGHLNWSKGFKGHRLPQGQDRLWTGRFSKAAIDSSGPNNSWTSYLFKKDRSRPKVGVHVKPRVKSQWPRQKPGKVVRVQSWAVYSWTETVSREAFWKAGWQPAEQ